MAHSEVPGRIHFEPWRARVSPTRSDHAAHIRVAILPSGALLVEAASADDVDPSDDGLSTAARARLLAAFARGPGHGLLDLGTTELDAPLSPPVAFLREIGRAFATRLRATPDLEERRGDVEVDCPADERARLLDGVPPMPGAEYIDADWIGARWAEIGHAFADEIRKQRGPVADWLGARHPSWHVVGKVCLHLAENRGDDEHPFAFLATYAVRAGAHGAVQHRPLARALEESSARRDRRALLQLLVPLQRAAESTEWLAQMIESGAIYEPLAWTPADAHRFLHAVPSFESAGLVVRVPDWWRARRPPRPEVAVRVGEKKASGIGMDALLDFSVAVALGEEKLSAAEVRALIGSADGLVRVRGRWVELDRERLRQVLDHWEHVRREADTNGLSFLEGMRLLAGATETAAGDEPRAVEGWSRVEAGTWLAQTLDGLRGPGGLASVDPGADLHGTLRPYQKVGVSWLSFASSLELGVCLADDMGLGKTIQVLALLLFHKRHRRRGDPPHLLVLPASLLANWQAEIDRFAPSLAARVAHPSAMTASELAEIETADLGGTDLVITTYGTLARTEALQRREWSLAILDEAQAIKNPGARQTRAVKAVRARARLALTGTPVENRLGDLWSIFDFLNPGLLGSARNRTHRCAG